MLRNGQEHVRATNQTEQLAKSQLSSHKKHAKSRIWQDHISSKEQRELPDSIGISATNEEGVTRTLVETRPAVAGAEADTSSSITPEQRIDLVKELFPSADPHPLTPSVCSRLCKASSFPATAVLDVLLVLFTSSPPVLMTFLKEDEAQVSEEHLKAYNNALTRELTSLLQGQTLDPMCIVPVLVRPKRGLKAEVEKAVAETKSLVPYGRWMMTESKFRALQDATKHVLSRLQAQVSSTVCVNPCGAMSVKK